METVAERHASWIYKSTTMEIKYIKGKKTQLSSSHRSVEDSKANMNANCMTNKEKAKRKLDILHFWFQCMLIH